MYNSIFYNNNNIVYNLCSALKVIGYYSNKIILIKKIIITNINNNNIIDGSARATPISMCIIF